MWRTKFCFNESIKLIFFQKVACFCCFLHFCSSPYNKQKVKSIQMNVNHVKIQHVTPILMKFTQTFKKHFPKCQFWYTITIVYYNLEIFFYNMLNLRSCRQLGAQLKSLKSTWSQLTTTFKIFNSP